MEREFDIKETWNTYEYAIDLKSNCLLCVIEVLWGDDIIMQLIYMVRGTSGVFLTFLSIILKICCSKKVFMR